MPSTCLFADWFSSLLRTATTLIQTLSAINFTQVSRHPLTLVLHDDVSYSHPAERGVRETHCYLILIRQQGRIVFRQLKWWKFYLREILTTPCMLTLALHLLSIPVGPMSSSIALAKELISVCRLQKDYKGKAFFVPHQCRCKVISGTENRSQSSLLLLFHSVIAVLSSP